MEERNFNIELETLLAAKTFGQLSAEEKSYVLGLLTEEEYTEYALVLSRSKAALLSNYNNIQPSAQTAETLTKAFRDKQPGIRSYPLAFSRPVYKALMAAALLIIITSLFIHLHSVTDKQPMVARQVQKPKASHDLTYNKPSVHPQTTSAIIKSLVVKTTPRSNFHQRNKNLAIHNSIAVNREKHDNRLCADIRTAPDYFTITDSLSKNTPGLNTRVIIPGADANTAPSYDNNLLMR